MAIVPGPLSRNPKATYESDTDKLRLTMMQATTALLRPGVFGMLKVRLSAHYI